MRLRDTLLRAIRARRADRDALDQADRLIAGDPALRHLVDAIQAPATAREHSGEQATIAALAAERRRAAAPGASRGPAVAAPRPVRTIVVTVMAAVAVVIAGGTAVAARTGHLPDSVQQDAHRLFSDFGVPAPSTSPARPSPSVSSTRPEPTPSTSSTRQSPAPSPSVFGTPSATVTPSGPAAPGDADRAQWCSAWQTAADGGHPMNGRDRRDLIAAAGGRDKVAEYCAGSNPAPTPTGSTGSPGPGKSDKPKPSKKPRPTRNPPPAPSAGVSLDRGSPRPR